MTDAEPGRERETPAYPSGLQASLAFVRQPDGWRVTLSLFDRATDRALSISEAAGPTTLDLPTLVALDGYPATPDMTPEQMAEVRQALEALSSNASTEAATRRVGTWLLSLGLADQLESLRARTSGLLDIAITLDVDDPVLNGLPWELMHDQTGFVAARQGVAITRRVRGTGMSVERLVSPPRILFVVGTSHTETSIRAGAEYLGLLSTLRRLKRLGASPGVELYLKTRVLLAATPTSLQTALDDFAPSVVHFICHGVLVNGAVHLELQPDDGQAQPAPPSYVNVDSLLAAFRRHGMPQMVILNACDTASARVDGGLATGQEFAPFAVRLMRPQAGGDGVPVVVAMAGEVADDACRLFARAFYTELLDGGDFVQSTAAGRTAGLNHLVGQERYTATDWAFPVLYLSEAMRRPLTIDPPSPIELKWYEVAANKLEPRWPSLCGRFAFLEQYAQLMGDDRPRQQQQQQQQQQPVATEFAQVLAVHGKPDGDSGKVGMTWLLRSLAAAALRDGHLPCLLISDVVTPSMRKHHWKHDWPLTFNELLELLMTAANNMAGELGLDSWAWTNHDTLARKLGLPGVLDDAAAQRPRSPWLSRPDDELPGFVTPICRDLIALLEAADARRDGGVAAGTPSAPGHSKLLILVDDVHKMSEAAEGLIKLLLGPAGLSADSLKDRARAIFTYADGVVGDTAAQQAIRDAFDSNGRIRQPIQLTAFEAEKCQAYLQYLLGWKQGDPPQPRPLMVGRAADVRERVWRLIDKRVKGYPGNFGRADEWIEYWTDPDGENLVRPANDMDLLLKPF